MVISSSIRLPHKSRTNGDRASKSCSFQRKYTVTGLLLVIISSGVKSDRAIERTTVSVSKGRILAVKVPHADSKKRSVRLAFSEFTSKNTVASSGDTVCSRSTHAASPDLSPALPYDQTSAPAPL